MRQPDEILTYIRQTFAPEDSLLQQVSENLKAEFPQLHAIQIGAEEGKLLQMLVCMAGVRTIVEVGSLAGYSALWMARGLPEGGMLHAINSDPAHARLARQHFAMSEVVDRLTLHEGDAKQILPTLEGEAPFDMIFIDADKGGYAHYLDWAEANIRKGGLIVGDNTLLFGHVIAQEQPIGDKTPTKKAWNAMREFNQRLADPARYRSILIPTAEGLTVAQKLF